MFLSAYGSRFDPVTLAEASCFTRVFNQEHLQIVTAMVIIKTEHLWVLYFGQISVTALCDNWVKYNGPLKRRQSQ